MKKILLILIAVFCFSACHTTIPDEWYDFKYPNEYGNSTGNLAIGGYFAAQGKWIYCADDNSWNPGLFRVRFDGSGKEWLDSGNYITF